MIIDVTAVYDDGTRPYADDIRRDPHAALRWPCGVDVTIRVRLVNPAGAPVELDLDGDDTLILNARTPILRGLPGSRKVFGPLSASAATRGAGEYDIAVPASATAALPPHTCAWDLRATKDGVVRAPIEASQLVLTASESTPS